jgi:ribosomal protein S18 acetylase RimI-like enzyme
MASFTIRPANVEDIESIVEVRFAALTEDEIRGFSAPEFAIYSSVEKLRKMWNRENVLKDGFEVFVAEDKGKIVGFIAFKVEEDAGFIDNLVVAKKERGKGIGRSLVAYVEHIAGSEGCRLMKTDTTENAKRVPWKAYSFWIRMGYEDTGERLSTDYDFKEIPLVKTLNTMEHNPVQENGP